MTMSTHLMLPDWPAPKPRPLIPALDYPVVVEQVEYASFWRRFMAGVIDGVFVWMALLITGGIINAIGLDLLTDPFLMPRAQPYNATALPDWMFASSMLTIIVPLLYFGFQESSTHQATIGKRALGIVVTDLDGQRISLMRAFKRQIASVLSALLWIGYLIQPFTHKRQALHDIIAGTLVVKR